MMKRYDLVLFDVDGTLINTQEGLDAASTYTLAQFGYPRPTDAELRTFIGPPLQEIFERHCGVSRAKADEMSDVFRNRYQTVDMYKACLYPGVEDTLARLFDAGVELGVVTYKHDAAAQKIVRHFGLDRWIRHIRGVDNDGKLDKADLIRLCLAETGVAKDRAVLVGDTDNDGAAAHKADIVLIGVTYGFGYASAADVTNDSGIPCADMAQVYSAIF